MNKPSTVLKTSLCFFAAVLYAVFLGQQAANAQSKSEQGSDFSFQSTTSLNERYFFDQAGFRLATLPFSLDEFIDPDTYQLGVFDMLSVYSKGVVEFSYRGLTVNASGDVIIPSLGVVSVKNLTLSEAQEKVKEAFGNQLKDANIQLTLDQPRKVTIHIGGDDLSSPGSYTVQPGTRFSALISGFVIQDEIMSPFMLPLNKRANTIPSTPQSITRINFRELQSENSAQNELSEAFFTTIGSKYDLRLVKVSNGEKQHYIDLKAYFNSGNTKFNPYIADGDRVNFIKRSSERPRISISGAVINDFEGTFRTDDTFNKLLEISGGLAPNADSSSFIIYREDGPSVTKLKFSFGDEVKLQPNDRIIITSTKISENLGSAFIEGQVSTPGIFTIKEGKTTLADLLEMADGITDNALPKAAYMYRQSFSNRGVNSVSSINPSLLFRSSDQSLEGFDYMKLEEALNDGKMPLDLTDAELLSSIIIKDGDRVFIPKDEHNVSIIGQVNSPGFYSFGEGKSVSDYISTADGYTVAADMARVFVIKAGSRAWYKPDQTQLSSGDIIFVDREPLVDATSARNYNLQLEQLKNSRVSLILAAISTVTGIITTYVAITR